MSFVIVGEQDHGVDIILIPYLPGSLRRVVQSMLRCFHAAEERFIVEEELVLLAGRKVRVALR
jgi:hypothetical protein